MKRLYDNNNKLKKLKKETEKTIEQFVENETDHCRNQIKRHQDTLKTYTSELKK